MVDEIKNRGIETALIKRDGTIIYSTFEMKDPAPNIIQYLANNAHFLMKELEDEAKEIEITFENRSIILVPLELCIFVGIIKNDEDKKIFRDYIESVKTML